MSFIFNVACPRCDTAVKILSNQSNFSCSRCQFQVVVEDKGGLLLDFKKGLIDDLDFVESPLMDPSGTMETGLKLSFSRKSEANASSDVRSVQGQENQAEEDFGNKTANTQIIQLTFDPAQYMGKAQSKGGKRDSNKKISLKKVIKHAEKAKPPKLNSNQLLMRYVLLMGIVLLGIILIVAIAKNQ